MKDAVGEVAESTEVQPKEAPEIRRHVEVSLPNGAAISLPATGEIEASGKSGNVSGIIPGVSLEKLSEIISGLLAVLDPIAKKALPGKTTVELGLEVTVEAGKLTALLVDGKTTGNLKLSVEWERQVPPQVGSGTQSPVGEGNLDASS